MPPSFYVGSVPPGLPKVNKKRRNLRRRREPSNLSFQNWAAKYEGAWNSAGLKFGGCVPGGPI
jgi:hypothetical protein